MKSERYRDLARSVRSSLFAVNNPSTTRLSLTRTAPPAGSIALSQRPSSRTVSFGALRVRLREDFLQVLLNRDAHVATERLHPEVKGARVRRGTRSVDDIRIDPLDRRIDRHRQLSGRPPAAFQKRMDVLRGSRAPSRAQASAVSAPPRRSPGREHAQPVVPTAFDPRPARPASSATPPDRASSCSDPIAGRRCWHHRREFLLPGGRVRDLHTLEALPRRSLSLPLQAPAPAPSDPRTAIRARYRK